jgi:hypothetical protein
MIRIPYIVYANHIDLHSLKTPFSDAVGFYERCFIYRGKIEMKCSRRADNKQQCNTRKKCHLDNDNNSLPEISRETQSTHFTKSASSQMPCPCDYNPRH